MREGRRTYGQTVMMKLIVAFRNFANTYKDYSVPCRDLRHVKEPKSDVEVVTFGKILGHFTPVVPPSAAGFASVTSDAGGLWWRKLESSKSLVSSKLGV
jgi:hypothetical protein